MMCVVYGVLYIMFSYFKMLNITNHPYYKKNKYFFVCVWFTYFLCVVLIKLWDAHFINVPKFGNIAAVKYSAHSSDR